MRIAATVVAASAKRCLAICTQDLEPQIYEYPPFIEAVKRLVLGPRFARVRVLVLNPGRVSHHRHPFIALARKLTSYIEIRNAAPGHRDGPASFIVADRQATLYRLQHARWEGICDLQDRAVARTYLERFDGDWHPSGTPRSKAALLV